MPPSESRPDKGWRALNWTGRALVQGGRSLGQWAGKRWRMRGVRKEIRRLEAHRGKLCRTIGEKVYLLFQRNQVRNRDLLVLCEEIRDLDVQIDEKEEDYRRIHAEGVRARTLSSVEVWDEPLEPPRPAGPVQTLGTTPDESISSGEAERAPGPP